MTDEEYRQLQADSQPDDFAHEQGARLRVQQCHAALLTHELRCHDILVVGCHEGYELFEFARLTGAQPIGLDIVESHESSVLLNGFVFHNQPIDRIRSFPRCHNMYASHVLEHALDRDRAVEELQRVCRQWIWIVAPIEPNGSENPAHCSPFRSEQELTDYFDEDAWVRFYCHREPSSDRPGHSTVTFGWKRL